MADEFPMPFDHAAILFATARLAFARMREAEPPLDERDYTNAIPKGVMNCGEVAMLIPLLIILLPRIYPDLLDDALVEAAIRTAVLPSQTIQ